MSPVLTDRTPIRAAEDEKQALREIRHALDGPENVRIVSDAGEIEMPESVHRALCGLVGALLSGEAVSIVPLDSEYTTNGAADFLGMSRPHLITLLERGEIPYRKVGTHRRIQFSDLVEYRERRDTERGRAFAALVELSEEAGLYKREDALLPRTNNEG